MTPAELGKFIDELTDLRDRFDKAAVKDTPSELGPLVRLVRSRLAALEFHAARPLPDTVKFKGRKPERRRPGR